MAKAFILLYLIALLTVGCSSGFSGSSDSSGVPASPANPGTPGPVAMNSILVAGIPFSSVADKGTADGIPGQFSSPNGVAIDSSYYYIADGTNKTIRRIHRSTGSVQTIAGVAGLAGTADGNGATARFSWPTELLLSGTTLYISDFTNSCIRSLDVSNASFPVTTVLGLCGTSGTTDGVGTNARFFRMTGMSLVNGFLYVSDYGNSTIRKVQLSNMQVTTVAGAAGVVGATASFTTDSFGTLTNTSVSTLSALYYDMDLGLIGTTLSAVFRIK